MVTNAFILKKFCFVLHLDWKLVEAVDVVEPSITLWVSHSLVHAGACIQLIDYSRAEA